MSRKITTFQAVRVADGSAIGPERFTQAPVTTVAKSASGWRGDTQVLKRTYVIECAEVVRVCVDGKIKGA